MAGSRTTGVRVLLSAESFLPATNGVTNSVLRVCDHLLDNGHEVLVVAPGEGPDRARTRSGHEARVERVRSVGVPRYGSLDVGLAGVAGIARIAERYDPDVVHLAAPVALGRSVGRWAEQAGVPTVALFQTDLSVETPATARGADA